MDISPVLKDRTIVLSTHSDDAVIAVGGLMAQIGKVQPVVLSCGGSTKITRGRSKFVQAYTRIAECRKAFKFYGCEPLFPPTVSNFEDRLSTVGEKKVLDFLYGHLRFEGSVLLAPMDDGHQDHAFVNRVASIIGRNPRNQCQVFYYALPYKLKMLPDLVTAVSKMSFLTKMAALGSFKSVLVDDDVFLIDKWCRMLGGFVGSDYAEGLYV